MEENKTAERVKMTPQEWIENFWYHYKWHTLIVLFFVMVITVCTLQMCERESYDAYVMYAGGEILNKTSAGGDSPDYVKAHSALSRYGEDTNGDGDVNPSLLALFAPSDEEILAMEAEDINVDYALVSGDTETLSQNMQNGYYYLCFLSEDWYFEFEEKIEGCFVPLSAYTAEGVEYEYAGDTGIYLRDLPIYQREGIRELPEDTVVCLRTLGAVASVFDKDGNEQAYAAAEDMLREILLEKE